MKAIILTYEPVNEETGTWNGERYLCVYLPAAPMTIGKYEKDDRIFLEPKPSNIETLRQNAKDVIEVEIDFLDHQIFSEWLKSQNEAGRCARIFFSSISHRLKVPA